MIKVTEQYLKGLTFIDLFAGIGGFHYALSSYGAECLYASEWDKPAQETYFVNHGIMPSGDITKIAAEEIPPHDILCGGFPCQAFSISGKRLGFEDTRGTLFFDIARIVKYHHPKVVFMENVKNLALHDKGRTFKVVAGTMDELGYTMFSKVLNSGQFGVPQHRERIYMVCFRKDILGDKMFGFPNYTMVSSLKDLLECNPMDAKVIDRPDIQIYRTVTSDQDVLLGGNLPNRPLQIGIVNKGGQGERIYDPIGHAITLSAYGGGAGAKTGLYLINGVVRKLSPRECARLQGFPDDFIIHPNIHQAYKQFGNSVTINVLQYIVDEISKTLGLNAVGRGSLTAKHGFQNEEEIAHKFNNWRFDEDAQHWLHVMNYNLKDIEDVKAVVLKGKGYKTDVQVQVTIYLKTAIDVRNLQVKLVSNMKGYNQIDKRRIDRYVELWDIPTDIVSILRRYTGELPPTILFPKDKRRMFATEFSLKEQELILDWLRKNKFMIVSDILKGRGEFAAEWMLVAQKVRHNARWVLKPMNICLNFFGNGEVEITKQGNFRIGRITMQRKGGDRGRETSKMLQFKINPAELFD